MIPVICRKSIFLNSVLNQTTFFIAFANAIYLASTEDIATVGYFFNDQVIVLPVISKINPPTGQ